MSIDIQTVHNLARLSMLEFSDEEAEKMSGELGKILDFVSQLQEVETEGVEPMTSAVGLAATPERPDEITGENVRDAFMKISPASEMGFYVVPRVVE